MVNWQQIANIVKTLSWLLTNKQTSRQWWRQLLPAFRVRNYCRPAVEHTTPCSVRANQLLRRGHRVQLLTTNT